MNPGQYGVLGTNLLRSGQKTFAPERKTAAILGYLALEGPPPGSKLAGLLWPDSEEVTARNNLSQTLCPLLEAAGEDVIVSGRAAEVATCTGELPAPLDYDDLPEFSEWLWNACEELQVLRKDALESLVTNLRGSGRR